MKAITYLVYIVFWEALVWGGAYWLIVKNSQSGWLWLLAAIMSSAAYRPDTWAKLFNNTRINRDNLTGD